MFDSNQYSLLNITVLRNQLSYTCPLYSLARSWQVNLCIMMMTSFER